MFTSDYPLAASRVLHEYTTRQACKYGITANGIVTNLLDGDTASLRHRSSASDLFLQHLDHCNAILLCNLDLLLHLSRPDRPRTIRSVPKSCQVPQPYVFRTGPFLKSLCEGFCFCLLDICNQST